MTETFRASAALLAQASEGDEQAWSALVTRHTSLLWAVARSYRLEQADAADVVQTTWLRLLEHLDGIEDPNRLVGWLVTTTRRECLRVLRRSGRERLVSGEDSLDGVDEMAEPLDTRLIRNERDAALWRAFHRLPDHCQQLLRIVVAAPQPYDVVSAALNMPVGSIGPTRARCLARLRKLLGPAGPGDTADAGGRS